MLQHWLDRRKPGQNKYTTQRREPDEVEILSGVFEGVTTGTPIQLMIRNTDQRSKDYGEIAEAFRPGHADITYWQKYGIRDYRGGGRSSARETAARVAAGGVARVFLGELGIETWSFTAEVGGVGVDPANCTRSRDDADASPLRCPDPIAEAAMIARIDEARAAGDTVGGIFEVVVHGLPIGLGSYVHWDRRLDGALAAAVMSINIVKGVEFGLGFEQTRRFGSAVHDVIEGRGDGGRWIHRTNNDGGLTGGVTNGEPLVVRGAVKPISTLARPLPSADLVTGEAVDKAHYERSDISVVPAAGVVAEAMVMLTLAGFVLEKFGGDTIDDVRAAVEHYRARIAVAPEAPIAGGRPTGDAAAGGQVHGLTGTDEAGSGGDD
jgi:chorismate synthase